MRQQCPHLAPHRNVFEMARTPTPLWWSFSRDHGGYVDESASRTRPVWCRTHPKNNKYDVPQLGVYFLPPRCVWAASLRGSMPAPGILFPCIGFCPSLRREQYLHISMNSFPEHPHFICSLSASRVCPLEFLPGCKKLHPSCLSSGTRLGVCL